MHLIDHLRKVAQAPQPDGLSKWILEDEGA
jgi:hypothetical protein